jgi:hypothetical protein
MDILKVQTSYGHRHLLPCQKLSLAENLFWLLCHI